VSRLVVLPAGSRRPFAKQEIITMIPTVNVMGGWETVMEGPAREELERTVLPEFLRGQRWFGGKGRRIETVRFVDWGGLPPAENRVFALLLEVRFADGKSDLYFLPLGISSGEAAARMQQSRQLWLIARLIGTECEALLHDALADDDTCMSLMEAIGAQREFAMRHGRIRTFPTAEFPTLVGGDGQKMSVSRGPAKSSNTLINYGQRLLLKLIRHPESGINPEFEIGRYLTEGRLFQRIPRVAGAIEYHRPGSEPFLLAILQSFVVNQGDGWQHALDLLGQYYERASNTDAIVPERHSLLELTASAPPPAVEEAIGGYLGAAATLGRRTAEMHHALSADPRDPHFAPEPFTPRDVAALHDSIRARGEIALAALRDNLEQLPQETIVPARQLLDMGEQPTLAGWWGAYQPTEAGHSPSWKIRCHGDYHLGQVLRVADDYVIIDFEGEPMRTVAERRAKQSPLKDVAGMLRSYHTAAYAGLFAFRHDQPGVFARLRPWAELWFEWVSAAFLREYRAATREQAIVPGDATAFAELLDAFMLEKNLYELEYELNNRPDWVRIPLRGILTLLENASSIARSVCDGQRLAVASAPA
jgi:maltose alpha-D-glucosyltransferase/alpha-amylase